MNLEKLKDTARKLEQKEEWRKAIEVYLKAIQQAESGSETTPDLSLYNRVGDLYLKVNDTAEAVRSYERAVDLYADQGFFNNAIALCGKILRVNPGRTQTYLKLAQLHARKNVVIEAKRNLIEFLERMNALGQLDQAFQAVKLFADQFSGSQEIRSMLVELLKASSREDEAREQLEKMADDLDAIGDKAGARKTRDRLTTLETDHRPPPAASPPRRGSDLIFLDTGVEVTPPPSGRGKETPAGRHPPHVPEPEPDPLPEPEPVSLVDDPPARVAAPMDDLIIDPMGGVGTTDQSPSVVGIERIGDSLYGGPIDLDSPLEIQHQDAPDLTFDSIPLEGMQGTSLGGFGVDQPSPLDLPGEYMVSFPPEADLHLTGEQSESLQALPEDKVMKVERVSNPEGHPMIPELDDVEAAKLTVAELENRVLDDPENPDVHRQMADGLSAAGELTRVPEELELALAGYEDREDWTRAAEMANRLVEFSPDSVASHQKRVELAYRAGDRGPLLEAYLGLGDALAKSDALDKAIAVYNRVIEHDPDNLRAAAALKRLGVGKAEEAPPAKAPAATSPAAKPTAAAPPPPPKVAPSAPPQRAPSPGPAPTPRSEAPPAARAPAPTASSQPRRPAASGSEGFVDLGSMILDDDKQRDTRMRINRREPSGTDEQREFQEILEQFKRGIDQNLDSEDYQSHYDLGVAFKEMGLLDEAIGEFQKALRSQEGRLRTTEALGTAFFEKGQYAACEAVVRRALDSIPGTDEEKIGLLYWAGRASEALGKNADAMANYERAMMVDIRFMDLSQRMQKLTAGRRR